MKTLILNKRVMSPRNILNNLVEGDINLVNKAIKFFKEACRPTVGYKQIALYLNIEVLVVSKQKEKSAIELSNEMKKAQYREELRLMKEAELERKRNNSKAVSNQVEPVIEKTNNATKQGETKGDIQQGHLDFDSVEILPMYEMDIAEVGMDHRDWDEEDRHTRQLVQKTVEEYYEDPNHIDMVDSRLTYEGFAEELYKGFHLKTTRRLDEIERVIKAVYRKHKGNVTHPEACRNLCIQAREAYKAMMDENPSSWTWIPTHIYTKRWFAHAVRVCTPNEE